MFEVFDWAVTFHSDNDCGVDGVEEGELWLFLCGEGEGVGVAESVDRRLVGVHSDKNLRP